MVHEEVYFVSSAAQEPGLSAIGQQDHEPELQEVMNIDILCMKLLPFL